MDNVGRESRAATAAGTLVDVGRLLYRIVDTAIVVICLPAYAVLLPLAAAHAWVAPRLRRVRMGMEVSHWPAHDQREDLCVVDISRLSDHLVGVRRRTWNVLHRRGLPPPPYDDAVEFWPVADFRLGRRPA